MRVARRVAVPTDCADIIRALLDAGLPQEQAQAWADGWNIRPLPGGVAAQAVTFADHGIVVLEAIEWHQRGFHADEACCFFDAGYSPTQAATLARLVDHDNHAVCEWVASGLPADRVIAYLRAGIAPSEVAEFESTPGGAHDALAMLGGLLEHSCRAENGQ